MVEDTLYMIIACLTGATLTLGFVWITEMTKQKIEYRKPDEEFIKLMKDRDEEFIKLMKDRDEETAKSHQRLSEIISRLDKTITEKPLKQGAKKPAPTPMPSNGEPKKKGRGLRKPIVHIPHDPIEPYRIFPNALISIPDEPVETDKIERP